MAALLLHCLIAPLRTAKALRLRRPLGNLIEPTAGCCGRGQEWAARLGDSGLNLEFTGPSVHPHLPAVFVSITY